MYDRVRDRFPSIMDMQILYITTYVHTYICYVPTFAVFKKLISNIKIS